MSKCVKNIANKEMLTRTVQVLQAMPPLSRCELSHWEWQPLRVSCLSKMLWVTVVNWHCCHIKYIKAAKKLSITRTLFRSQSQSPFRSDRPWGGFSRLQTVIDLWLLNIAHWPGLESKMREHLHNLHVYRRMSLDPELFCISVLHWDSGILLQLLYLWLFWPG